MKFLLYFHFYAISCGDSLCHHHITTVITNKNDSIMFYIYDLGYYKWKIERIEREQITHHRHTHKKPIVSAIYFVSFKDIEAIITISTPKAEIRVLTNRKPEIIQLKE